MRTLVQAVSEGNDRANVAIEVFCYRLAKAILSLSAPLDRVDALIFTGGIGENSTPVRTRTVNNLRVLGAKLDERLNEQHGRPASGRITTQDSGLLALVVPTNEELVIARETAQFLTSTT
jgi:acetate kinase